MADRGTKRKCQACGAAYYDLNRNPILCPKCGARYEHVAPVRAPKVRPAPPVRPEPVEPEAEVEGAEGGDEEFEEAEDLPSDDENFVAPENEDEER